MATIQTIWFWLIIILTTVYAILDGSDLGAGILYPFARDGQARKKILSHIAPFWDASEVWLLTAGGALFAAFPAVYAGIFSRLYLPIMLAVFALIFRAISVEFIDKSKDPIWKFVFGAALFIGSALPPIVFGMAAGALLCGELFGTFSFLSGAMVLFAFTLQGAAILPEEISSEWRANSWTLYLITFVMLLGFGVASRPKIFSLFVNTPVFWMLFALIFIFMMLVRIGKMILYSSLTIAVFMMIFGASIYFKIAPVIVHLSSSEATLKTMLVIALIGMPIVVGYTVWFHKVIKSAMEREY